MQTNWRQESPQLLVIFGMFLAAAVLWPFAPDRIPVHWNLAGEVDQYGGKFEGMLLLPLITAGLYLLMLLLPRIDPARANYATFWTAYTLIRFSITCLLAFVYACAQLVAFQYDVNMSTLIPLSLGLLFCVLGNVMGKIRPNWFVGVRTPWTLQSRTSWNKTHRLAGPLFILFGLCLGALSFVHTGWMLAVVVAAGIAMVLVLTVYSYLVWRNDPDRLRAMDASPDE